MTNSNYCCNINCAVLSVVAAIIVGAVTAILAITAVVASTPAFLWVAFGIAIVALALTFSVAAFGNTAVKACIAEVLPLLLTGIFGALVTALVLLAVTFAATSIVGAIILGALLLFLTLIVTTTACVIMVMVSRNKLVSTQNL